ncbi:MAG: hypothetical protein J0M04_01455 [Verrucomicrobia bacterium]|nr:hypothetical protein [Verrucomicrobiota bacterium]
MPVGDQNAVGSELLWRTVRGDGGLALPIFVRTPQPKVHPRQTTGRLETVSGNSSGTFTYGYETNSSLVKTVSRPGILAGQPELRVTNTWEPSRDVLLTKANELVLGETVTDVSSITYTVNAIGQRTHATRTGAATNGTEWGYDILGQLEAADDTTAGRDRSFAYDSIGNRLTAAAGDWDTSGQTPVFDPDSATAYTPNALNQYDAITTDNTPFTPIHDDDGNQKDAQILPLGASEPASCVYHWDAENRLTSVTSTTGAVLASYAYDAFSRLISRSVGVSPTTTTAYIYDGWNRIAQYTVTPGNPNITPPTVAVASLSKTYLWGLDLSGSFQGAGGVGGLLSVNTIGGSIHYPTYDGNGNITEYLTVAGDVAAHFEYDPFGNTLAATGDVAQFEYRFSTKPQDSATGLYYYGYRFYDPLTGRWPSRDPIGETFSQNLNAFVSNSPVTMYDTLGLANTYPEPTGKGVPLEDKDGNKTYLEPKCTTSVCGPDITKALQAAMRQLTQFFRGLPLRDRISVCATFYDGDGWDIEQLYQNTENPIPNSCGQASSRNEENCGKTVTYEGSCYYRGSVNYVLWGRMHDLCGIGQNPMNHILWARKVALSGKWTLGNWYRGEWSLTPHHSYYPAHDWAQMGYFNKVYPGSKAIAPASDRPYCKPCTKKWNGPFSIHVGVLSSGEKWGINGPTAGRDDYERESKRIFPQG